MKPRVIVHGGAWSIPDKYVDVHVNGVHHAIAKVYPDLLNGMSALDAVEAAVRILEEDPIFAYVKNEKVVAKVNHNNL